MSVVKRAMLLLLLAAIGTDAAPEDCGGLNKTLPTADLHKQIFGDWVLVWSVSDAGLGTELLENLTSSRMELRLLPDNNAVVFNERNQFKDESCTWYFLNVSMPSKTSDDQKLRIVGGTFEKDGVSSQYNDSIVVDVFESCSDCLTLVYRINKDSQILCIYKRLGHHQDVEQLKAAHSDHQKLAECLSLPVDKPFSYDGAADFCPEKSAPAATSEQS